VNKYETVIILNPNLSTKVDDFKKDFEKNLKENSFTVLHAEDIGRRQLAYSINNHNKGHYLIYALEGDPSKLSNLENKIKYNDSIIRHLFLSVKNLSMEDSSLLKESKNKKDDLDKKNKDAKEEDAKEEDAKKTNNKDSAKQTDDVEDDKAIAAEEESVNELKEE